ERYTGRGLIARRNRTRLTRGLRIPRAGRAAAAGSSAAGYEPRLRLIVHVDHLVVMAESSGEQVPPEPHLEEAHARGRVVAVVVRDVGWNAPIRVELARVHVRAMGEALPNLFGGDRPLRILVGRCVADLLLEELHLLVQAGFGLVELLRTEIVEIHELVLE